MSRRSTSSRKGKSESPDGPLAGFGALFTDKPVRYPNLFANGMEQEVIDRFVLQAGTVFELLRKGQKGESLKHPQVGEALAYIRSLPLIEVFPDGQCPSPKLERDIANFLFRRHFGWKVALPGVPGPDSSYVEVKR